MFFECVFTSKSEQFDYYRDLAPAVFKQHAFASKGEFHQFIVSIVWTLPTIINNLYERNETWSSGFPPCRVAQNKVHAEEATVTSCVVILTVAVEHFPPLDY